MVCLTMRFKQTWIFQHVETKALHFRTSDCYCTFSQRKLRLYKLHYTRWFTEVTVLFTPWLRHHGSLGTKSIILLSHLYFCPWLSLVFYII